ncbi:hypothetical protein KEJ45_06945 [Candidatus Bathyarchaeota archaeon]|nr:hypothetical protein [Candidatus Bathyarchaeota archaeon]
MRSDYALYTVAIIFFILTGLVLYYQVEYRDLWIVTTAVLGLFFIGLGYTQRPKTVTKSITSEVTAATQESTTATISTSMPEPAPAPPTKQEIMVEETPVVKAGRELTEVKGIGAKRAEQLKSMGILSVEDLANASAKTIASKLKISPKIAEKWVEGAKRLTEKS